MAKIIVNQHNETIPMRDLPADTYAVVMEGGDIGNIVFRRFSPTDSVEGAFVMLTKTRGIDSYSHTCSVKVRPLSTGESFTIVI